jgi:hypothetical protein
MIPNKVVKAKVKLKKDASTAADKKREAGMVAALEKEDFYGKKKKEVEIKAKPLSEKEGEAGMISQLEKEDFYGDKKKQERFNKMAKEAIFEMKTKEAIERFKKSPIMRYKKQ